MSAYNFLSIPIPSELVTRVVQFLQNVNSDKSLNSVLESFIEYGLENAGLKLEMGDDAFGLTTHKGEFEQGYLWTRGKKSLFLPQGTQLMREYKGSNYFAAVDGNKLVYAGKNFDSPAQLARFLSGNTSVNAWTALRIKRPGDQKWRLAADMVEPG